MDRETRRVNFTKLQVPVETRLRTTRSSKATAATISNYFSTPSESNEDNVAKQNKKKRSKFKEPPQPPEAQINLPCKTTKLSTFLSNVETEISTELSKIKKPCESEFFEKSQPKVKKAPTLKTNSVKKQSTRKGRTKGQPNIKSAFLRNEQMFSEITAQHCRADNFNPDEIELALALSKSEVDSCSGQESEQVVDAKEKESVRSKLQKYGFRTAAKEDYNAFSTAFLPGTKRGKRDKWANKFTALTLRNPEIQAKKLNEKVQAFLEEQEKYESMNVVESFMVKPYQLLTRSLKPLQIEPENLICTRQNERETKDLSSFYVTELFEISKVPAGHLLKNWAKIEGRDLSPVRLNERTKARLQRFKEVYDDLEVYFDKLNGKNVVGNDKEILVKKSFEENEKIEEHEKSNNELDQLINLIEDNMDEQKIDEQQHLDINSTNNSPLKEPPDKRTKLNSEAKDLEESSDMMSSFEIPITQVTRSASPDLFADSDEDYDVIPTTETDNNQVPMFEILDDALHNFSLQIYKLHDNRTNDCNDDRGLDDKPSLNDQPIVESVEEEQNLPLNQIIDLTQDNSEENEPILCKKDETMRLDDSFEFKLSSATYETEKDKDIRISFTLSNEMPNSPDKSDSSLLKDIENEPNLFNFQHEKQLNTEFHKQTALGTRGNDCKMDNNNDDDDDTFFTDLYEKYMPNNRKSKSFTKLTPIKPQKIRKTCSFTETKSHESFDMDKSFKTPTSRTSLNKSVSFSSTNAILTESANSIDLTQNESSSDEENVDDDCILLSDDEINYSIWKSDKTFSTKDQNLVEGQEKDFIFNQSSSPSSGKNYSLLDEFDHDHVPKLIESPEKSNISNTLSTIRLNFEHDNDDDELKAYLLSSQTQSDNSRSPNKSELSRERAEFGIMDAALSEPLRLSQLGTPAHEVIGEEEEINWTEASFVDSPSNMPMTMSKLKRYSNNSNNKFKDFLSDFGISSKEDDSVQKLDDEIDEFDKFVLAAIETGFERKDKTRQSIVPSGLDQLLTGELNFNVSQDAKTTSPTKESEMPTKLVPDKELNIPEEVTVNGSAYKVNICTSPKPDFQMMPESEILKRLYNYGIKPLKRTQAVKMLEFIYNQTHSIMLAAAEEPQPSPPAPTPTQINSNWSKSKSTPSVLTNVSRRLPLTQNKSAIFTKPKDDEDDDGLDELFATKDSGDSSTDKLQLHDAYGDKLLRYAHDLQPDLVAGDEWFVLQTNVTKKTPQPLLPLHIAWHNLLCANPKLHETVIMFEPIDLQEIYLFLKKLGYRYDPKDLKIFFDRRCIIFRYDLTAPGKQTQRHIRKPKRTKANIKRS